MRQSESEASADTEKPRVCPTACPDRFASQAIRRVPTEPRSPEGPRASTACPVPASAAAAGRRAEAHTADCTVWIN